MADASDALGRTASVAVPQHSTARQAALEGCQGAQPGGMEDATAAAAAATAGTAAAPARRPAAAAAAAAAAG
jgi:hypothetical protein